MTQRANNRGRHAELDEKKRRAAGREENTPERQAIRDPFGDKPAKGATAGAFGRGKTNRGQSSSKSAPIDLPRSSRPARKRGAAK